METNKKFDRGEMDGKSVIVEELGVENLEDHWKRYLKRHPNINVPKSGGKVLKMFRKICYALLEFHEGLFIV